MKKQVNYTTGILKKMIKYRINFKKSNGIVPVIIQDYKTGDVLMLAYMNDKAFNLTQSTGFEHYRGRSKNRIWEKGESSGYVQVVKQIFIDCHSDTLLLKVDQIGKAACHEGYRSCFFRRIYGDDTVIESARVFDPSEIYKD